jgi:hypothetical protein
MMELERLQPTDRYFAWWGLFLPIASFLLIPFIQGTTPAYLFALGLVFPAVNLMVLRPDQARRYYIDLLRLGIAFATFTALAQLAASYSDLRYIPWKANPVDPNDQSVVLRRTMFTQSLYLLAAASTFVFVRNFYTPKWDRYFLRGALLLAFYGFYEVTFFLIFHRGGDFLSNRTFGGNAGSLFQLMQIGPLVLQRLKSLTGEPSMYAFTVLPFWIYALHTGRLWTQRILFVSLLLSTSSTAAAGIAVYLTLRFLRYGVMDRFIAGALFIIGLLVILAAFGNEYVLHAYDRIIGSRLAVQDYSSMSRLASFMESMRFYGKAPILNQILGLGFGYIRATNMLSTLLVNVGALGLLIVGWIFLRPVISLGWSDREFGIKAAVIVIFTTMMISVPEFSYLSTWLFLGIAYHEIASRTKPTDGAASELRGPPVVPEPS